MSAIVRGPGVTGALSGARAMLAWVGVVLAVLPLPGLGQSSPNFEVPMAVLSTGGAYGASAQYQATSTLGQAAAGGERIGPTLVVDEGFQPGAYAQTGGTTATNNASVTITQGQTSAMPGDNLTYTVTVSSDMNGVNLNLSVDIPPGLESVSWSCTPGVFANCTPIGTGPVFDTITAGLPPATAVYTVHGQVAASASGTLTVTATVVRQDGQADADPADDTATHSLPVLPGTP